MQPISRFFHRLARPLSASRRRGAVLLEFAIVATLFLTLLVGMLQFGIYLSASNTLWNLSREGARFASVQCSDSATVADNNANIIKRIAKSPPIGVLPSDINASKMTITITPDDATTRTKGTPVTVAISYDMTDKLFIPLGGLLNNTYKTSTTMTVE